jgi:hypothetical protein
LTVASIETGFERVAGEFLSLWCGAHISENRLLSLIDTGNTALLVAAAERAEYSTSPRLSRAYAHRLTETNDPRGVRASLTALGRPECSSDLSNALRQIPGPLLLRHSAEIGTALRHCGPECTDLVSDFASAGAPTRRVAYDAVIHNDDPTLRNQWQQLMPATEEQDPELEELRQRAMVGP